MFWQYKKINNGHRNMVCLDYFEGRIIQRWPRWNMCQNLRGLHKSGATSIEKEMRQPAASRHPQNVNKTNGRQLQSKKVNPPKKNIFTIDLSSDQLETVTGTASVLRPVFTKSSRSIRAKMDSSGKSHTFIRPIVRRSRFDDWHFSCCMQFS